MPPSHLLYAVVDKIDAKVYNITTLFRRKREEKMADLKFLQLLSKDYPNIKAATAEIINLNAILALPKGTEYFLSDLHGEHEAFVHMLKSASGTIKAKIDEHYGRVLSEADREDLAALNFE